MARSVRESSPASLRSAACRYVPLSRRSIAEFSPAIFRTNRCTLRATALIWLSSRLGHRLGDHAELAGGPSRRDPRRRWW